MLPVFSSRRWPYRLIRIAVLVIAGWWLLTQTGLLVRAERSLDRDWPRTDFSKTTVNMAEILSGGPPKDGIPAIDHPRFIASKQAKPWLHAQEPVIVVEQQGKARAYPLQILIHHEIVNDTFAGSPIAVTFCPLCNASMVFERRVGNQVLDFGTTGKLRKSDLVMYDRQTESWWQQFTGEAIVGHYSGAKLKTVPSKIVAFAQFQKAYPQGQVMSRHTGYLRYFFKYGSNPYRGYDRVGQQPFLFTGKTDPRLPAMERVVNVSIKGRLRLYPYRVFKKSGVLNDTISGTPIVIFYKQGLLSVLDKSSIEQSRTIPATVVYSRRIGRLNLRFRYLHKKITDVQTGSEWNLFGQAISGPLKGKHLKMIPSGNHFAFAWLAFNPESEIYGVEDKHR